MVGRANFIESDGFLPGSFSNFDGVVIVAFRLGFSILPHLKKGNPPTRNLRYHVTERHRCWEESRASWSYEAGYVADKDEADAPYLASLTSTRG